MYFHGVGLPKAYVSAEASSATDGKPAAAGAGLAERHVDAVVNGAEVGKFSVLSKGRQIVFVLPFGCLQSGRTRCLGL